MKEIPFVLDKASILAILHGHKTQLRIPYHQRTSKVSLYQREVGRLIPYLRDRQGELHPWMPYGDKGDCLWIKERFAPVFFEKRENREPQVFICYQADSKVKGPIDCPSQSTLFFDSVLSLSQETGIPFLSARSMPRFLSRLFLSIQKISIHRLQELSDTDLIEEGFDHPNAEHRRSLFQAWWRNMHPYGPEFRNNPFVWVIHFEKSKSMNILA